MKSYVKTDELIVTLTVIVSLLFSSYTIGSTVAAAGIIYLLICVFFRKYEDAQRNLRKK